MNEKYLHHKNAYYLIFISLNIKIAQFSIISPLNLKHNQIKPQLVVKIIAFRSIKFDDLCC